LAQDVRGNEQSVDHNHAPPPTDDLAAFRAFYEAHLSAVYRFIYSRVGNREEAEDLTAHVFTKALHGVDWSRDEAMLVGWLFQVARTTLADHWRHTLRLRTLSLDDLLASGWDERVADQPPEAGAQIIPEERVAAILQQLSPHYRDVLRCRFLLNYTIKETAQALGLSEANVKVIQLRALRRAAELQHSPASPAPQNAPEGAERHG
jgi:RNA polymerase sigma-70 factor (ECF subfamily)